MPSRPSRPVAFLLVLLAGALWLAAASGFLVEFPVWGDGAAYLEEARRVADGAIPHRDFFEMKAALVPVLAAPFLLAGRLAGLPDWLAARLWMAAAGGLLLALAWSLGLRAVREARPQAAHPWRLALLAAAALLALRGMPFLLTTALEPKIFVLIFLLGSLDAALAGRARLAGLLVPLAAGCWQPAALAWPVLLLAAAAGHGSRRRQQARRFLAGNLLAAAGLGAALVVTGAWSAFLEQTVGFPLAAARLGARRGALDEPLRVAFILWHAAGPELLCLAPFAAVALLRGGRTGRLLAGLLGVFAAWCLLDFQSFPDTQVLVGPAAVLGGIGLALLLPPGPAPLLAAAAAAAGLLPPGVPPPFPLAWQRGQAADLAAAAPGPPDAPWLALGDPALVLLAGRRTANRFLFLSRGTGSWLDARHPGGRAGWIREQLDGPAPVLVLGRGDDPDLQAGLVRALAADPRWRLWRDLGYPAPVTGWPIPLQVWFREAAR